MTTRTSFISNSSSSSFILAAKDDITPEITVTIPVPIDKRIKTIKELDHHFLYEIAFTSHKTVDSFFNDPKEDTELKELYKKLSKKISQGKTLFLCYASNESDNPLEQILWEHGIEDYQLPDNIEIIQNLLR